MFHVWVEDDVHRLNILLVLDAKQCVREQNEEGRGKKQSHTDLTITGGNRASNE